ncbi:MAG: PQQ-binding-like beta-propeller repeat protein [Nitrospirae bacterium]|nr:PQQ-binding-like beta-propeller repeat protein [Nitrospirota bacterium]
MRLYLLLLFLLVSLCAPMSSAASLLEYKDGDTIHEDTTWSRSVVIEGVVFVPEGVTLTIEPGTEVRFGKSDAAYSEGDEGSTAEVLIPGSGIRVEGRVIARGTRDKRITFTSAQHKPAPGDWGCIFLDHSKGSIFKYCNFSYSAYTIHAHFSRFDVSRCVIKQNEDGSRLGMCRATFDHCDITGNTGKGLNFRQCRNTVTFCNIRDNHEGIFLNEKDEGCVIENNNITGNAGMALRLGEFHATDVTLNNNYWGTADLAEIDRLVYDHADDPEIGTAFIGPMAVEVAEAGVDGFAVSVLWKFKTGGFVDSSACESGGVVYFGSWDRKLYAVKAGTGELLWSYETGDCVDSSPAVADGRVYFGSWDRNIYCLDAATGLLVWKFTMAKSEFDDHRQASPLVEGGVVYMGGFNGSVYALKAESGELIWEYRTGGPVRSRPALAGGLLYVGSGDGKLHAIDAVTGSLLWTYETGGPVNTEPLVRGGSVFFGSRDGNIYFANASGGGLNWGFDAAASIEYSSPLLTGNAIITGSSDGKLYALDKDTGKPVWVYDAGAVIYSSPRYVNGLVVVGDNCGGVHFLDAITGEKMGYFKAGEAVQSLSTGPDGTIHAGSRDGYMYAITGGY